MALDFFLSFPQMCSCRCCFDRRLVLLPKLPWFSYTLRRLKGAAKPGAEKGLEEEIKTACDMVQQRHQREFDRNLDIFDRYVKKNLKAAMPDHAKWTGVRPTRSDRERSHGTEPDSTAGRQNTPAAADDTDPTRSDGVATWGFELDEAAPPKRVEDERALDAELQRLRKRRREVGDIAPRAVGASIRFARMTPQSLHLVILASFSARRVAWQTACLLPPDGTSLSRS